MRFKPQHQHSSTPNADFLRNYARIMFRDARSEQPSKALPIARRIHAAGILPFQRLTDLYRHRESLQLKHLLRTIAVELGFPTWDACKRNVDSLPTTVLDRFRLDLGGFNDYEQIWFPSQSAAQEWQREQGGRIVAYGNQAVILQ